jgi:hypothetical protein
MASLAPPVMAQSATGAVAGRAEAGDQITVTNTATGLIRTVSVGADGSYRLSAAPRSAITRLQVTRDGQRRRAGPVNVALGGTTTVNLGGDGQRVNLNACRSSVRAWSTAWTCGRPNRQPT